MGFGHLRCQILYLRTGSRNPTGHNVTYFGFDCFVPIYEVSHCGNQLAEGMVYIMTF